MHRLVTLAALAAATPAFAQPAPSVTASNAWSRATPPGATTGAAYMTLTSKTQDKLTAISSPEAASVQIHEMKMSGNVMQMREVEGGLPLPANTPVTLAPGGYHAMLMGLKAPLKKGDTVRLHLTFEHSPPLDVDAPIAAIGASSPAAMPGHQHSGM